jgi:hypothetical protein
MYVNTNTFQTGLGCALGSGTNTYSQKHCKKENGGRGESIERFVIFISVSCEHAENFDFHSGLMNQCYRRLRLKEDEI